MEKKSSLSKVLAITGTVLVWIPIIAPFLLGFVSFMMDGIYRFDYLMPVEIGILAAVGGVLLLWGTIRTKSHRKIIAWGLGIMVGAIIILFAVGDVEPGSLRWVFAIGLLITYSLAIIGIGLGGILLWKDLVKKSTI
ncbi:MAG: hypothetical protein CL609_25120 [Anaerolineaceae bacterium]|nr:hypothetical protein [Anaerolineaceae bacterium]